jgi:hypothetical protein
MQNLSSSLRSSCTPLHDQEVIQLLKDRLSQNNPRKQWLALQLVELVLESCKDTLGHKMPSFQNDLLQEVARRMYDPARADTDEGKRVRYTAKEILRKYGAAGTNAFRAVQLTGNSTPGIYSQNLLAPGTPPPFIVPGGSAYNAGGNTSGYAVDNGSGGATGPRANAQLQDEVKQLIDKSKSNAELLSDMLLNSSCNSSLDEFESDLIKDLTTQCRELREMLNGYLEKLALQHGETMERLLAQTLEAADSLDCALSLQKARRTL